MGIGADISMQIINWSY